MGGVPLPSITVVTPCLNARPTLPQALASVRAQDHPDVEHLVIDGGSKDGTLELLEDAPGVSFVSEPDRGLSHAVNKGIARARGDVIGWLNADDFYLPGALSRVARALADRPDTLWATGRCLIVDAEGREIRRGVTAYKDALLRRYSYGLLLTQNFVSCPASFVRRQALARVGPREERRRYTKDEDLWLRLGRLGDPVVLDERLAAFRMAEGSLSMANFERQFIEHAANAREHGRGHRAAVAANLLASRGIVATYRALRLVRRLRAA